MVQLVVQSGMSLALLAVTYCDLEARRIPNRIVAALLALRLVMLAFACAGWVPQDRWGIEALAWSSATALVLLVLVGTCTGVVGWITNEIAMGAGDYKLYLACMVWLLPEESLMLLLLSSLYGLVLALSYRLLLQEHTFPFGPAIVLAYFTTVLAFGLTV